MPVQVLAFTVNLGLQLVLQGGAHAAGPPGNAKSELRLGPPYKSCNSVISPGPKWAEQLSRIASAMSGQGKLLCFLPGTYVGQITLRDIHKVRFSAPTGRARFVFKKPIASSVPESFELEESAVTLQGSTEITFNSLSISNTSRYPDRVTHKVSRALSIQNSKGIIIRASQFSSFGKDTVVVQNSTVSFFKSKIECYYFCLAGAGNDNGVRTVIRADESEFVIDHKQDSRDIHPAFWMGYNDYRFDRSRFVFRTGAGFVGGLADPKINSVIVNHPIIENPSRMLAWVLLHPNYSGIQVRVTGTYSPHIWSYYCVSWENPGCVDGRQRGGGVKGMALLTRANEGEAFSEAPLPN